MITLTSNGCVSDYGGQSQPTFLIKHHNPLSFPAGKLPHLPVNASRRSQEQTAGAALSGWSTEVLAPVSPHAGRQWHHVLSPPTSKHSHSHTNFRSWSGASPPPSLKIFTVDFNFFRTDHGNMKDYIMRTCKIKLPELKYVGLSLHSTLKSADFWSF